MFQDLQYGVRMLLKNKGTTVVAILSLALGIGANSAVFSLVDTLFVRKLPVRNPQELVQFRWDSGPNLPFTDYEGNNRTDPATKQRSGTSFSYAAFRKLRDRNQTLSDVFAFSGQSYFLNIVADGHAEIGEGQFVSGNYYTVLGLQPARGRLLSESDDKTGAAPVAVISYRFWERRFQFDPSIVGKSIAINTNRFTIVGVTPPEFAGALQVDVNPDVSIPLNADASAGQLFGYLQHQAAWWLRIMGRTKPGITSGQIRSNLESTFQESASEGWREALSKEPSESDLWKRDQTPRDVPRLAFTSGSQGAQEARASYWQPTIILFVIVGAVLLIACINIANLMLARSAARQREIAVRLALGAGRLRLIRQLLTESVLLAMSGGAIGAIFAYWGQSLLLRWGPWTTATESIDLKLNVRVFAFTAVLSLLSAILFGIVPTLRSTRVDLNGTMKAQSRGLAGKRSFLSKGLLVLQVAMSVMLLIGAGLFIRTLQNLYGTDAGFNSENLLLFNLDPSLNHYTTAQMSDRFERTIELIQAIPGVRSATFSQRPPLSGGSTSNTVKTLAGASIDAHVMWIRSNFFDTVGMRMLFGRSVSPADLGGTPRVVVVNDTLARKYFSDTNPIGSRLDEMEIVGVVHDAKYSSLRQNTPPTMYIPYTQGPVRQMSFEVRSRIDPLALVPSIREAVRQVDSNLPISNVRTQIEQANRTMALERLFATMSSLFGGLALLLACVGLYGVMSCVVERRINEIGIRMALGASQRTVLRSVMAESLLPVFIGVVFGVGGALVLTRTIASMLFGITPYDLPTLSIAIMIAVAVFAGYLPARRASRIDPLAALRYE